MKKRFVTIIRSISFLICLTIQAIQVYAQDKAEKTKVNISVVGGAGIPIGNYSIYGSSVAYGNTTQHAYCETGYFVTAEAGIKLRKQFGLYVSGGFNNNSKNTAYFQSDFQTNNPNWNNANVYTYNPTTKSNQIISYFAGVTYTIPVKIVLVDFKLGLGLINSSNGSMQCNVIYSVPNSTYSQLAYSYTSTMINKSEAGFNGGLNIRYNHTKRIGFKLSVNYYQTFSDKSTRNETVVNYLHPANSSQTNSKVTYSINLLNIGAGIILNL